MLPTAAQYFQRVCEGAKFIREAVTLGEFQGDSVIRKKLRHPSCNDENVVPTPAGDMPVWKLTVWYAVVDTLAPELIEERSRSIVEDANGQKVMLSDTSPKEAEIVARAIEAEADRLEAQRETGPPAPLKSEAVTGVSLRDVAFAIEGDDKVATDTVNRWSKSGKIKAEPIGKCPLDGRCKLYRLFEILDDIRILASLTKPEVEKYRIALVAKQRIPK